MSSVDHDPDRHPDLDLPEGWTLARLRVIADSLTYGYTASATAGSHGPRFLRITDIQNGRVDWGSVPTCMIEETDIRKYGLVPGDIVFARTGATTGKSFLIRSCPLAVFASYLIRLRLLPEINPALLDYFFQTPDYWTFISENVAGIAQPNCNATKLSELQIPIPPSGEQPRLVEAIAVRLSNVGASRDHLFRVPAILKRFRQAVLTAACSGRLTEDWRNTHSNEEENGTALAKRLLQTKSSIKSDRVRRSLLPLIDEDEKPWELPDTWAYTRLGNLCSQIADIDHKMPKAVTNGVKFISAKDLLDDGTLNLTREVKLISEADYLRLSRKAKPQRNDIIYSRIGARLGKARLVETDERFLVSYSCCIVRPLIINPKYLMGYLDSGVVLAKARQQARSIGVPDLGLDEINNFVVPLPPLAEQEEIVTRLDAFLAFASRVEKHVTLATRYCDSLTQSILAKAFRGELVPTEAELARREGREYEPASVLLERIRAGRDNQVKSPQVSKHKSKKSTTLVGA